MVNLDAQQASALENDQMDATLGVTTNTNNIVMHIDEEQKKSTDAGGLSNVIEK
jgi:hypothetical protein